MGHPPLRRFPMTSRQLFAAYLALNGAGLSWFALWATRQQLALVRQARIVPAAFIGWRETRRQGRINQDFTYTALYRYKRNGIDQEACGMRFRSRFRCDLANPLGWPWRWLLSPGRQGEVVRYGPDASQSPQVGRAWTTWASLLLLWAAGLALLVSAARVVRQG